MTISSAVIVPHPPMLIPQVGAGRQRMVQKTVDSYHEAAQYIAGHKPETIILISPHAPAFADYIHIAPGATMKGDMKSFGGGEELTANLDQELTEEVCRLCGETGLPAGTLGGASEEMDHGTFVPLYFLNQYYTDYKLIVCSLSGLSREAQYQFGVRVKEAVENLGRSAAVIASGDLSHKLKEDGPYSFAKEGPELDKKLTDIMKSGQLSEFVHVDKNLCRLGAECGVGAFITLAGILDEIPVTSRFLSYEGKMGVGYAVCIFDIQKTQAPTDPYVKLAKDTLESYVQTGRMPAMPNDLPTDMTHKEAGTFVSIKKNGQLRGCIGTIAPTQDSIAMEIMQNAISSGTRDPRFTAVTEDELSDLTYNVDILSEAHPVTDRTKLDPKRFGVIVSKGMKRGLLLPNLEGVDTVEQQIEIACQKAGIYDDDYDLESFEVVRHI